MASLLQSGMYSFNRRYVHPDRKAKNESKKDAMSAGQQARKQAMEGMNDQEKREYSEAQRKKQKDKNLNQKKDKQKWRKNRKDNSI